MRTSRVLSILTAAALATGLAACSSDATDSAATTDATGAEVSAETSGAFPVTVPHAFGETTIGEKPERVATVAWANHEVPLALGIVPVGMSKATWGDDDNDGVLPWVEDELAELGAETPVLFDETDSIPFEQVADTRPDVILAAYSGLTQEDYEQLSKIAPVIAYPDIPWGTSLDEMVEKDAAALGLADEGEQLNQDLDAEVDAALDEFPALRDKKVLFTSFGGESNQSSIGFYTTQDPRADFLADAGLGVPSAVAEASRDTSEFWVERSAEEPEAFEDVDLIVSYGSDDPAENEATLRSMQEDPLLGRIPAIRDGNVAFLGGGPLAAAANPSPLSIPWGIRDYFEILNGALEDTE